LAGFANNVFPTPINATNTTNTTNTNQQNLSAVD